MTDYDKLFEDMKKDIERIEDMKKDIERIEDMKKDIEIEKFMPEENEGLKGQRTGRPKGKAKKPKSVDTSRKLRRMAITQLYFDNAPRPKGDFEDYLNHSDGIREQIISGVDAWK